MQKQIIDVSFWTMLKVALLALLVWAIWMLRDILSVLLLSIIIASAIEPANHWFARHRIPRVLGVIFIFLLAFSIFVSIFYLVLPPLFSDIFGFLSQLPVYVKQTFAPHGVVFSYFPDLPLAFKRSMLDTAILLEKSFESYVPIIGSGAIGAGSSLFGGAIMFILLIVISFYLSVQEHGIEKFLRIITPLEHET
ncbi:MAG: AI-2E family transporter, partial [Patescibacteria group bacterium]